MGADGCVHPAMPRLPSPVAADQGIVTATTAQGGTLDMAFRRTMPIPGRGYSIDQILARPNSV
jgi:hypothetical protein